MDLLIIVNAASKIDSVSEMELSQILRGRDNHLELVGLSKQYYDRILKELAKTNTGDFKHAWLTLITAGKRKKDPVIADSPLNLVALWMKNKNAIAVLSWENRNRQPAEPGLKVVRIFKKKQKFRQSLPARHILGY